jgi:hypothetical protein
MILNVLKKLLGGNPLAELDRPLDAEYEPVRDALSLAGLDERKLRKMKPDDRVAALEKAKLDPYDYIYLACG